MKLEKKTIKKIIAGCMAFVCACTTGIVGFATNWFGAGNVEGFEQNNQLSFGSFFGSGISLVAASAETLDATGQNEITLTATVNPEGLASYVKVDWSVAWQNADSEWATGKTVTDYITVTPTAFGALTAKVACKAAFGEKVVVSVSVRDNATLNASCVCDYRVRNDEMMVSLYGGEATLLSYGSPGRLSLKSGDIQYHSEKGINVISVGGVGTAPAYEGQYDSIGIEYWLSPTFKEKLTEYGFEFTNKTISYMNYNFNIPGFDMIQSDDIIPVVKCLNYAHGMDIGDVPITVDDVSLYNAYSAAMQATIVELQPLLEISISLIKEDIGTIYVFRAELHASIDYLPDLPLNSIEVLQTNIIF